LVKVYLKQQLKFFFVLFSLCLAYVQGLLEHDEDKKEEEGKEEEGEGGEESNLILDEPKEASEPEKWMEEEIQGGVGLDAEEEGEGEGGGQSFGGKGKAEGSEVDLEGGGDLGRVVDLPPFIVFNAHIDGGLEVDGKNFAEMLKRSGNDVRYFLLWGTTHGTIGRSSEVVKICCELIQGKSKDV
jgi:hypothetical protein